jgi:hypothetical protein
MSPEIVTPDPAPLEAEGLALVTAAKSIQVLDEPSFRAAGVKLREIATTKSNIVAAFRDAKEKAHAAHKAITTLEAGLLLYPAEAEAILRSRVSRYLTEEENARKLEESKRREEERRKAEADRLLQAEALDRAGDTEAAVQALDRPVEVAPIELPKPKAAGISSRSVWKFEVVDAMKVGGRFLTPDLSKIQGVVNGMKAEAAAVVGGIRVWEEKVVVARRS